jgi:alkyl hydroperoxide reductase subunit AhpC
MATLWIDGDRGTRLRDWLQGDWAIVFSHPSDFRYDGLESDRWLAILRSEFVSRGVRPLACRRGAAEVDAGWTSELDGDGAPVRLDASDLRSRALRQRLLGMPPRFVMIVDETLGERAVLKYSAGRTSASPLDLLASVDAMRRRGGTRIAA